MGAVTPFPEAHSPELERFAVSMRAEVVGLLNSLQREATPLNVFLGEGAALGLLRLADVDEPAGSLVLEGRFGDGVCDVSPEAQAVTVVGFAGDCKLQFSTSAAQWTLLQGQTALTVPIPAQMLRIERRAAPRFRVESGRAAVCRIPRPGESDRYDVLRVADISARGLALVAECCRPALDVGDEIEGCRLDLPRLGGVVVGLRVCRVERGEAEGDLVRYGCQFAGATPAVLGRIQRYADALRGFGDGGRG